MRVTKNEQGFTLVELLTVVIIASILLGIGIVSGRSSIGKARVEEEAKHLYSDLVTARQRAMNRSRIHFAVIDEALSRYQIWEDTDPSPDGDGNRTAADAQVSPPTTTSDQLRSDAALITFDSQGLASPNGKIWIEHSLEPVYDCVNISATRIRLGRMQGGSCVS